MDDNKEPTIEVPEDSTAAPAANPQADIDHEPAQSAQRILGAEAIGNTTPQPKHKKISKKKLLITGVSLVVLAAIGAGMYLYFTKDNQQDTNTTDQVEQSQPEPEAAQPAPSLSWVSGLQKVAPLEIFDKTALAEFLGSEEYVSSINYYLAGKDADKEIYLVDIPADMSGYQVVVTKSEGVYTVLMKTSVGVYDSGTNTYNGPKLASGVIEDKVTTIEGLTPKETITFNGVTASLYSNWLVDTNMSNTTEVAKINEGVVYERVVSQEGQTGIKQMSIILKQPSNTYAKYRFTTTLLKDDNSVTVTWKNGSSTTQTYQWSMVWGGCGNIGTVNVLDKAYINDLVEIGKMNGQTVYTLKSANHPVMDTIYTNYNADGQTPGAVTKQQMYDEHGVIIVKNELGYRLVLVDSKYQRAGECGKPVIYLYPTTPQPISVKVGADITKSIPAYANGWTVFALPNGTLLGSGGVYDSLFWEGIGHGKYPEINAGFVVKRSDVETTLKNHLAQLGLTSKESSDFLEYWLPLMPNKPYVRLTWFNTQQMNELAPLQLSSAPDTLIRIFLDFQGLDEPINLPPQQLSHPSRNGFVVVEWGGLLTTW